MRFSPGFVPVTSGGAVVTFVVVVADADVVTFVVVVADVVTFVVVVSSGLTSPTISLPVTAATSALSSITCLSISS